MLIARIDPLNGIKKKAALAILITVKVWPLMSVVRTLNIALVLFLLPLLLVFLELVFTLISSILMAVRFLVCFLVSLILIKMLNPEFNPLLSDFHMPPIREVDYSEQLVLLVSELDLVPANDHAKSFMDIHWIEVLDLENYRRDLELLSWRKHHPILASRDDVHKSFSGNLFPANE